MAASGSFSAIRRRLLIINADASFGSFASTSSASLCASWERPSARAIAASFRPGPRSGRSIGHERREDRDRFGIATHLDIVVSQLQQGRRSLRQPCHCLEMGFRLQRTIRGDIERCNRSMRRHTVRIELQPVLEFTLGGDHVAARPIKTGKREPRRGRRAVKFDGSPESGLGRLTVAQDRLQYAEVGLDATSVGSSSAASSSRASAPAGL